MLVLAALLGCCTLSGLVHGPAGVPLPNATITLQQEPSRVVARSDTSGHFSIHVEPGSYILIAHADGYAIADVGPIDVRKDVSADVALEPADSQHLRPIGEVTVDGRLALSRSTVPSVQISRRDLEQLGFARVIEALPDVPSLTMPRPDGGSDTAPAVVALRGPDPSETLITLDGQLLNDANTGDLDLSRFPVAAFSAIDVTEGLGPADLEGSNTIGGAVNLVSLRPTAQPHHAFSLSAGSFGRSEAWFNATGTQGRFGYAMGFDDQQEGGYVNQDALLCQTNPCTPGLAEVAHLGSSVSSRSSLAHLTWSFSPRGDVALRIFALGNQRDESAAQNAPDPSNAVPGGFIGPGPITVGQSIRAYDLRARGPLGAGTMTADYSASNNNVALLILPAGTSPYDVSHHDRRETASINWQRSFERSEYALGGYVEKESLSETNVGSPQSQAIASYFARASLRPFERLRLAGAAYASHYTSFGTSIDGRLGASYDLNPSSALRFSIGTGFRAPLLIERYLFANDALPPPNADCVIVGQGNPNERAEHATEYELGYARRLSTDSLLDVSAYRTNLRDPIENFYPGSTCPKVTYSYPINVGNVTYQGAAVRFFRRFQKITLTAQYGLNVAYPYQLPATVSNPTSGGYLVPYEQLLGIPQHVGSLQLNWQSGPWHAAMDATFRGKNNELNQGPYALLQGALGHRFGKTDLTLALSNLTNAVSGPFTKLGAGVPYIGNGPTGLMPLPTDRYLIEPFGARLILTVRE